MFLIELVARPLDARGVEETQHVAGTMGEIAPARPLASPRRHLR